MTRLNIVAAIILNQEQNKIFITQRPQATDHGGCWEFPGGKVEVGETLEQALIRELEEEIDITVTQWMLFEHFDFDYTEKSLTFDFFIVNGFIGSPYGKEGQMGRWVAIEELSQYRFPEANLPVLEKVVEQYGVSPL